MANAEHLARLKQDVKAWNAWRRENRDVSPDLTEAPLGGANLHGADLRGADLRGANLREAYLRGADLGGANLGEANLGGANLIMANLGEANLREANLREAYLDRANLGGASLGGADLARADLRSAHLRKAILSGADLHGARLSWTDLSKASFGGANLRGARLREANLREAYLCGADLGRANLYGADLRAADLIRANLRGANLEEANLVGVDLTGADLTDCRIFGISAWRLNLSKDTTQQNLVITHPSEPRVTVDNIEVAQFVYLLLRNPKLRNVLDTIASKAVLILGRFTEERKKVLDAIREELRKHDYVPILFDFDKPASQDLLGTVSTLAHMARFIIADVTDPSSVPHELATIARREAARRSWPGLRSRAAWGGHGQPAGLTVMSLNTRWRPTDHDRAQSYTCSCHSGRNRHRQAPSRGAHRGSGPSPAPTTHHPEHQGRS